MKRAGQGMHELHAPRAQTSVQRPERHGDIPVNADFESGFASEPERLAENVRLAVATGVAGLSVEDRVVGEVARLYDASASVERIRAARGAIDRSGEDVVLVARTEGLL